jgi:hypothetical protein
MSASNYVPFKESNSPSLKSPMYGKSAAFDVPFFNSSNALRSCMTLFLLLCIAEKINVVFAARCGVRLGLEVATATSEKNIDLRAKRMRVSNLVLCDLLVRVAISHMGSVARRRGVVDRGCND